MTPVAPAAAPTVVDVKPVYLDNSSLIMKSLDYAAAASKISCEPQTATATFRGMKRNARFTHTSVESWVLNIDFAQDFETAGSFSTVLHDNQGKTETIQFAPVEGGQLWEVEVQLVPGGIGGQVGAHATSSISLGVQGEPRKVTASGTGS